MLRGLNNALLRMDRKRYPVGVLVAVIVWNLFDYFTRNLGVPLWADGILSFAVFVTIPIVVALVWRDRQPDGGPDHEVRSNKGIEPTE